jgi:hypothetical protein
MFLRILVTCVPNCTTSKKRRVFAVSVQVQAIPPSQDCHHYVLNVCDVLYRTFGNAHVVAISAAPPAVSAAPPSSSPQRYYSNKQLPAADGHV